MMSTQHYLDAIEAAHRRMTPGRKFCYTTCIIESGEGKDLCRLTITVEGQSGHHPVSDDVFLGTRQQVNAEARRLNRERLGITPGEAEDIILSSIQAAQSNA